MALQDQFNIKHNFTQYISVGAPRSISPSVWGSLAWKTLKTPDLDQEVSLLSQHYTPTSYSRQIRLHCCSPQNLHRSPSPLHRDFRPVDINITQSHQTYFEGNSPCLPQRSFTHQLFLLFHLSVDLLWVAELLPSALVAPFPCNTVARVVTGISIISKSYLIATSTQQQSQRCSVMS